MGLRDEGDDMQSNVEGMIVHYLEWLLVFSVASSYLTFLKDQFILSEISLLGLLFSF